MPSHFFSNGILLVRSTQFIQDGRSGMKHFLQNRGCFNKNSGHNFFCKTVEKVRVMRMFSKSSSSLSYIKRCTGHCNYFCRLYHEEIISSCVKYWAQISAVLSVFYWCSYEALGGKLSRLFLECHRFSATLLFLLLLCFLQLVWTWLS